MPPEQQRVVGCLAKDGEPLLCVRAAHLRFAALCAAGFGQQLRVRLRLRRFQLHVLHLVHLGRQLGEHVLLESPQHQRRQDLADAFGEGTAVAAFLLPLCHLVEDFAHPLEHVREEHVKHRMELLQIILQWRAGEHEAVRGTSRDSPEQVPKALARRVLQHVRLVHDNHTPVAPLEPSTVVLGLHRGRLEDAVRREEHVEAHRCIWTARFHLPRGVLYDRAVGPVEDLDVQCRAEALQLALPIREHARRAHDDVRQTGAVALHAALRDQPQEGRRLCGLPQPHLVCQHGAARALLVEHAQVIHAHQLPRRELGCRVLRVLQLVQWWLDRLPDVFLRDPRECAPAATVRETNALVPNAGAAHAHRRL
mmetsp:Transcript_3175/g.12894  ORF Transcript_3175/g.12894 Transcript_3175/m.12894 type:complete len:366 (-) Transcript_3175:695-1792(-)